MESLLDIRTKRILEAHLKENDFLAQPNAARIVRVEAIDGTLVRGKVHAWLGPNDGWKTLDEKVLLNVFWFDTLEGCVKEWFKIPEDQKLEPRIIVEHLRKGDPVVILVMKCLGLLYPMHDAYFRRLLSEASAARICGSL